MYETCPSGNFSEFVAVAIGARAQSAKTYLEKHHKTFKDTPVEELCTHALQALACVEINRCAAISAPRPSFWLKLGHDLRAPTRPYPESDTSLRPREIPNRRALEVLFPHRHWPVASLATRNSMPLLLR